MLGLYAVGIRTIDGRCIPGPEIKVLGFLIGYCGFGFHNALPLKIALNPFPAGNLRQVNQKSVQSFDNHQRLPFGEIGGADKLRR
ncbi:hypothetical protein CKO25_15590 [Thiocapsa imhoffii]|uniref:Uncharacterized protein n=1 Tax=Thiocapsa imhoffii TaxID=382777 RepID=A0A9X0WL00_9GAMM|nr:hypothetical protein [Thiocapsa imhoffii]